MSSSVLHLFSSKSFIVSGLTFRSLIHFEFISIYGVRKCSNFIALHVAVQFSQHLLKKHFPAFIKEKLYMIYFLHNQNKILYDPPPRVMEIKTKVNKWDLIKLKSFHTAKETLSKAKRQPSEWEKIIANETPDRGLISKIYELLIQFNTRKTNNPIKKWEKDLNRHFSKDIQMANRHMKRCKISLINSAKQIKTTIRCHLTLVRMAIIKKSTNNKHWRGCREKGTLLYCWWKCKLIQPLWKTVWRFLRKTRNKTTV